MKDIYIIRIDSSSTTDIYDSVKTLDYNTEYDFCYLLGAKIDSMLCLDDIEPDCELLCLGNLLINYKTYDEEDYFQIIHQWENILADIMNVSRFELIREKEYTILLGEKYIKWLSFHENEYYRIIGNRLSDKVVLSNEFVSEVIDSLYSRISYFMRKNEKSIEYITLGSIEIKTDSWFITKLKQECLFNYLSLKELYYVANKWTIDKFFPIHGIVLGKCYTNNEVALYKSFSERFEGVLVGNLATKYYKYIIHNGSEMPKLWQKHGFSWELRYEEWVTLLSKMNFSILDKGPGRLIAVSNEDSNLLFELVFKSIRKTMFPKNQQMFFNPMLAKFNHPIFANYIAVYHK